MSSGDDDFPQVVYLDSFPQLPANAPLGHPHILDLNSLSEDFPQEEATIPDIVVTILFKYKPEALKAFLDLNRAHVHFLLRESANLDFCILRNGKTVKVTSAIPKLNGRIYAEQT